MNSSLYNPYTLSYSKTSLCLWLVLLSIAVGRDTEPLMLFVCSVYIAWNLKGIYAERRWLIGFMVFFLYSWAANAWVGYDSFKLFQQMLLLAIVYGGYHQVFSYCRKTPEEWFLKYIQLMYVLAWIGLVQFAIMLPTGIDIFPYTLDGVATQNSGRLHACLMEPGWYAAFGAPATAYVFLKKNFWKENRLKSFVLLLAYVLTLTTAGFVALLIILLIKYYRAFRWLRIGLVVFCVLSCSYVLSNLSTLMDKEEQVPEAFRGIYHKVTQTLTVVDNATPEDFELLNASSYAVLTNYWIAFHAPHRLIGTGLGSHEHNYTRLYKSDYSLYGLNKDDAYSMFARMMSEFGWIGVCLYFYLFLYKCYNRENIISLCLLVFFISYLIKGGHYTLYGTAFFHFLYYRLRRSKYS